MQTLNCRQPMHPYEVLSHITTGTWFCENHSVANATFLFYQFNKLLQVYFDQRNVEFLQDLNTLKKAQYNTPHGLMARCS